MKNLKYIILFSLILFGFGCNFGSNDNNLSISTADTNSGFKFEANYPANKTDKVKTHIDSVLNNDLTLDQNIDLLVNLSNGEKFNLKAKKGWLEIKFDKKNSSLTGYLKVKNLAEGIKNKLIEK